VLAFLSVQNESEFESARSATSLHDLFTDTSAGAVKWRDALRSASIPHNGQRVLMDFISQLEYLEGHLRKLTVSAKAIADKAIAKRAEMDNLAALVGDWQKSEEEFGNSTKFEYPNKSGAGMIKVLGASKDVLSKWAQILSFEPTIVESVVYAALAYLLQQVDAFKVSGRGDGGSRRALHARRKRAEPRGASEASRKEKGLRFRLSWASASEASEEKKALLLFCSALLFCGGSVQNRGARAKRAGRRRGCYPPLVGERERSEREEEGAAAFLLCSSAAEAGRIEGRERSEQEGEGVAIRLSGLARRRRRCC
jgi:hypothetical protein